MSTPVLVSGESPHATLGHGPARNMATTAADGVPAAPDPDGPGLLWSVPLGTESYTSPVVAGGRVFVGTNNERPRDPKIEGDHGVLMALDVADGRLLWQATHAKLASGHINDWPLQGVCGTPTVDGDHVYYVSNRGELHKVRAADGASVWTLDMVSSLGVHPHHMSVSSPLVVDGRVFLHTSHGVDAEGKVPRPSAPSFLAVDDADGRVLWQDASPGTGIVDGQWSSPSYGRLGGRAQVIFPGGDGWVYSFAPATGKALWRFDASQHVDTSQGRPRENLIAPAVLHDDRVYIGVGHDPELGPGEGRLWAIDASGSGDVSKSAAAWSHAAEGFAGTLGAVAIEGDLLYGTDLNGFLHVLELDSGAPVWTYDTYAAVWAPPLVADGRVYVVDEDGDLAVLATGRTEKLLHESNLGDAILAAPTAAPGRLYVATRSRLFAFASAPRSAEPAATKETRP